MEAKPTGEGGPCQNKLFSTTQIQEFRTIRGPHRSFTWGVETRIAGKARSHYDKDNRRRGLGGAAISFAWLPDNLDRKVAELEMRCAKMAQKMEKKDKGKAAAVARLLTSTNISFTRQVTKYRLLEKFKVPQI